MELVATEEDDAVDFLFLPIAVVMVLESVLLRPDPGDRDFLLLPDEVVPVFVPDVVGVGATGKELG